MSGEGEILAGAMERATKEIQEIEDKRILEELDNMARIVHVKGPVRKGQLITEKDIIDTVTKCDKMCNKITTRDLVENNIDLEVKPREKVDHPAHYGGKDNPYEAIKVIEAWGLGFHLGNTVKYISRAGKKSGEFLLDDMKKAKWYLDRYLAFLEESDETKSVEG